MRFVGVVLLGLALSVAAAAAQQPVVKRSGHGTSALDARLDRILRDPAYLILTRDTTIGPRDTLAGPLLSVTNRLIVEGTIIGNLAVIDANVYLRPGSRVVGDVLNAGGGLYRSEQATVTGSIDDQPLAPYHVEREGENYIIAGDVEEKIITLKPTFPTNDRVNGFRPRIGAALRIPVSVRATVELDGWGAYALEPGNFEDKVQGGGILRWRRGLTFFGVGFEETTASNDVWIRSDLKNTLSSLYNGKDYRNYYEARSYYAVLGRDLVRGTHEALVTLRAQREHARSVPNRDPWHLFNSEDDDRFNPPIDDGFITSGILGLSGKWLGKTMASDYEGDLEFARADVLDGEFDFAMFAVWAHLAMQGLRDHTIEFEARAQGPLGTDSLPRQRWGILGGSGTLYTFEIGQFLGDRVAFLESKYSIPINAIRLPLLRSPRLEFIHVIGMAWLFAVSPDFEQNVGARVQFPFVFARFMVNPADTHNNKFSVGVTVPRKAYPWEPTPQK